jgi:hypothetical protein
MGHPAENFWTPDVPSQVQESATIARRRVQSSQMPSLYWNDFFQVFGIPTAPSHLILG